MNFTYTVEPDECAEDKIVTLTCEFSPPVANSDAITISKHRGDGLYDFVLLECTIQTTASDEFLRYNLTACDASGVASIDIMPYDDFDNGLWRCQIFEGDFEYDEIELDINC